MAVEYPNRENPKTGSEVREGFIVGRGENRRVIDPVEIEKLAKLWCSWEDMSDFFGVPTQTLKYNFSAIVAKGRSETKQALRRAQIKLALGGNATMLIWLGKNILDQSDNPQGNQSKSALPWSDEVDTNIIGDEIEMNIGENNADTN
jgi:hypothetical protein